MRTTMRSPRLSLALSLAPVFALALAAACAQKAPAGPPPSTMQGTIERAADLEGVPRPLLLALAYVDSRWSMVGPSPDHGVGLLHLVDRPDAPGGQSLTRAARLTGLSEEALRTEAFANARGGAALLRAEADAVFGQYHDLDESKLGDWYQVVMRVSGVLNARLADDYAAQVYRVLRDGAVQVGEGGALTRLSAQSFQVNGAIWGSIEQDLSGEYCPNGACVAFVPASTSNYTPGRGLAIDTIVIHDLEGGYAGSIGWFTNPSAQASAHYDVRSSDGEITQQVRDGDTAWHGGNWNVNQRAIGIEHEGYAHTGSQWYTEAMYRSSSALTRWLCDTLHIPKDRVHIIGHYEIPDPDNAGWFGGAGHHHDPCDSWNGTPTWHNNTACYWDWTHYMALVTGDGAPPPPPHVRVDQPSEGQTFDANLITVAGAAEVPHLRSLAINGEAALIGAAGSFSAQVRLLPGANEIVVSALSADGQTIEARVRVTLSASVQLARTGGCTSGVVVDLLAFLPLAALLRRRRAFLTAGRA